MLLSPCGAVALSDSEVTGPKAPDVSTAIARPLRIGTRGSAMAMVQTHMFVAELHNRISGLPPSKIVEISTSGDRILDRPLADVGGKGLFAKEIEIALIRGEIDLAVHSLKDLETFMLSELTIAAVLKRGDPHDALLADDMGAISDLPTGARIGTSSVRRSAQLLNKRPDLKIVPIRGNVNTRIAKLEAGVADALVLGAAGLGRIEVSEERYSRVSCHELLPAACQGVIAIQCRKDDIELRQLLAALNHEETRVTSESERALLATLDGSCRTPIGAYAQLQDDGLYLRALVATHDGRQLFQTSRRGPVSDGIALAIDAGEELRSRAPAEVFLEH